MNRAEYRLMLQRLTLQQLGVEQEKLREAHHRYLAVLTEINSRTTPEGKAKARSAASGELQQRWDAQS